MTDATKPIPAVLAAVPEIAHRLQNGRQFNTYELNDGGYAVCLGPVNDALTIVETDNERIAHILEAALRELAGQRRFVLERDQ